MKKCLFCAKEIQDEAVFCPYCGSRLSPTASSEATLLTASSIEAKPAGESEPAVQTASVTEPGPPLGRLLGLAAIIVAIGAVAGLTIALAKPRPQQPGAADEIQPKPSSDRADTQADYQLALVTADGYQSETGDYLVVEGQIKNVSGDALRGVTAIATWYDKGGRSITTQAPFIDDPILPGQTSSFKLLTNTDPAMSRYTVEFKTGLGQSLSVDYRQKK